MAIDYSTTKAVNEVFEDDFSHFDDPFAEKPPLKDKRDDKATLSPRATKRKVDLEQDDLELGLDEEVKILKKRKSSAKLDEARLLSEPGLPKIRALVRTKQIGRTLRLKGKGLEFDGAAKLLNYFQLWLDNLYPRAKFADALEMVEKAGHTKRMQLVRSEWINEGKSGYQKPDAIDLSHEDPDLFATNTYGVPSDGTNNTTLENTIAQEDSLFIPDARRVIATSNPIGPDDDELEALLMQENITNRTAQQVVPKHAFADETEGEDDLDALLAEQDHSRRHVNDARGKISGGPIQISMPDDMQGDVDGLDAILMEQESASPTFVADQAPDTAELLSNGHTEAANAATGEASMPKSAEKDQTREQEVDANEVGLEEHGLMLDNDILSSSPAPHGRDDETENLKGTALPYWGTTPTSTKEPIEISRYEISQGISHQHDQDIELELGFLSSSPIDTNS